MSVKQIGNRDSCTSPEMWELAELLARQAKAPEDALKYVFDRVINDFEKTKRVSIDNALKNKVWDSLSARRILDLKQVLLALMCARILSVFSIDDIGKMLEEVRKKGILRPEPYGSRFESIYNSAYPSIVESVVKKAHSMAAELAPEVALGLEIGPFLPTL